MTVKENLISLIIPTYKGGSTLPKLVEELILKFQDSLESEIIYF